MHVEIEEKDSVTYVYFSGDQLAFTDDGIVFKSRIKEPIPGLMVIRDKIMPYYGEPKARIMVHGLEHVLVSFDEKLNPVYALQVGDDWYITKNFGVYHNTFRTLHVNEVLKLARKYGITSKYNVIEIDGRKIRGFTDAERKTSKFIYGDERRVVILEIPFSVLDEGTTFSSKDIDEYVADEIAVFPEIFEKKLRSISVSQTYVYYEMKDRSNFMVSMNGTIKYNGREIEIEDVEPILRENITFKELGYYGKVDDGGFPEVYDGEDVFSALGRILKKYPYFGEKYAVPSKNLIITKRGYVRVKNFNGVPEGIVDLAAWVIGVHNNYDIPDSAVVKVILDGADSRARVYGKSKSMVRIIGKHYYWYSVDRGAFIGTGGFDYVDDYVGVIKYSKRKLVIGRSVELSKGAIEKLERGEKITIGDVVPGFPVGGTIKDKMFSIGKKQGKLLLFDYRLGKTAVIPYKDGLYEVYIPYNEPFDAWSPVSVQEIPEDKIVEDRVYIGFADEIPDDAEITYDGYQYSVKWGDNYITVTNAGKRGSTLKMKIGEKEIYTKDPGKIEAILSADSVKRAFFVAYMS